AMTLGSNEAAHQRTTSRLTRRRLLQLGVGLAAGAAVAPLVAACGVAPPSPPGSGATTGTGQAASSQQIKRGGKLTMSLADADVQNFDPIIPTDNMSIWTMLLIYDQLIRVGPDGNSLEPDLAEKWEVSQDGLNYTFHLRGAKFHDGSDVTADDAVYSIDRAARDKDSQWAWIFSAVDKLEAPDPKPVKIALKKPWAPLLAALGLYAASIIPQKLHQQKGQALFDAPVGSGPFKFDLWEKNNRIVLSKYPSFWESGKPYLDTLE